MNPTPPPTPWLAILGIGEDGALSPEAATLLATAALVIGGPRHLALAAASIHGETMPWRSPIADTIPAILARRPAPSDAPLPISVAVLASGDPLWFGVATLLLRHIPRAEMRIVPAISAFALATARLGWPLQDTACLSCCGRPPEAILPHLHNGARLIVLSADGTTPGAIQAMLRRHHFDRSTLWTLEALGGPGERIRAGVPDDIGPLNLVAIEASGQGLPLAPGLDDDAFEHDGQITKREIRAITLAALEPRHGELLWDIGCGSGSVAIEWLLRHPSCRAIAIERRPDRLARAASNARTLGVPSLTLIEGEAPAALANLPPPDAAFVGGGAHAPGVIDAAWTALQPGGRLVANAIALATEAALIAAQAQRGGTLIRVAIERLDHVGGMTAFRPAMTLTQWRARKPAGPAQ